LKPTIPCRGRHSEAPLLPHKGRRIVLGDIANTDLRNILSDEISSRVKIPSIVGPTRRIVSDPLPQPMGSLTSELAALTSASKPGEITPPLETDTQPSSSGVFDHNEPEARNARSQRNHPLLSLPDTNLGSSEPTRFLRQSCPGTWEPPVVGKLKKSRYFSVGDHDNIAPVSISLKENDQNCPLTPRR